MVTRTDNCLAKLARMDAALHHREADRVPISDFFWGSFLERWRRELGLAADADIYRHYDLDWIVTIPNMDPHVREFTVLSETAEDVVVRTGFEAVIRKKFADPMPDYLSFETDSLEKMEAFQFDDPWDERRFFSAGDNQVAGVGDGFERNSPAWIETVKSRHRDFPVYGSICEGHEELWRIIGSENVMLWIGLYPDELGRFIPRLGRFVVELTRAQIKAGGGLLDGMVIWGDVAYVNGMLFSPDFWRRHFKPIVREQIRVCHEAGLPVIYHGCGNASAIYEDFIEMGLDSYNPLEAKAGLDVVDLRRRYGHRMGFCGNMDARAWATVPMEELRKIALTKLNAARGGGYIFQSDHSVPSNVSAERYQYVVDLVRRHGTYPLSLGEFDLPAAGSAAAGSPAPGSPPP
jgi:uroporphyrinogen decarboxylase